MISLFNKVGVTDQSFMAMIIFAILAIIALIFGMCSSGGGVSETGEPVEGRSSFSIVIMMMFIALIFVCFMFKQ